MFLLRRGVAPTEHHRWWLSTCRLTASDWGTSGHYSCCWILELMGSFDQLDLPNIAAAEAVARRLQAIEWQYRERVRETSCSHVVASVDVAGAPALTTSEVDLIEGAAKTDATLMVCPLLIRYVSDESKTEADVSKAEYKASEERLLAHTGLSDISQVAVALGGGHADGGGEAGRRRGKNS